MITLSRFTILSALAGALVSAQPLPKAEIILDRYIEVTGGKATYQKHTHETLTGTITFPEQGLSGQLTRYAMAPDKEYSVVELGPIGKIESGFTDGIAWEKSAILGPRLKTGDEKDQAAREAQFNGAAEWRKIFPRAETTGSEIVNGEDCYKVLLTPVAGKPETQYFSKKSGLLLKTSATAVSPMGEVAVDVEVSDYRIFDGILLPTHSRQKAGAQQLEINLTSVTTDRPIPPGTFDLPPEIRTLIDKQLSDKQVSDKKPGGK
jgi:zinc protease